MISQAVGCLADKSSITKKATNQWIRLAVARLNGCPTMREHGSAAPTSLCRYVSTKSAQFVREIPLLRECKVGLCSRFLYALTWTGQGMAGGVMQ